MNALRESLQREANKNSSLEARGSKKQSKKKDVVDLRTLLIHCAQAVATDDCRSANDLLRQIRQHSSRTEDASQRLAHCFTVGSRSSHGRNRDPNLPIPSVKADDCFCSPPRLPSLSRDMPIQENLTLHGEPNDTESSSEGYKNPHFRFQNLLRIPMIISHPAASVHPGGQPRVRITGVNVPQHGFRPTERIEERGRRLADYAQSFNVPFQYHPIASRWEAIRAEDISIEDDEVVIVTCLYRFKNLVDETVVAGSPTNTVLDAIRKLNPTVFIHGVVNGTYGAPFFMTRFREALFHYSSLFDMLETVPGGIVFIQYRFSHSSIASST